MFSEAARRAYWALLSEGEERAPREVFALLDGARVRRLPGYLVEQDAEFECLLAGETDPLALTRAPYLARVSADSDLWRWLGDEGWGQSWGIFALARAGTSLDTVLRDLREGLHARLPDERVVYFRFFDPRVWRPFFPTCDGPQLRVLFGRAVTAFACEEEDGKTLLLDSADGGRPKRRPVPLPHD